MASVSPVILIADDEPAVRATARRALEADGYRILEARDGAEAVTMLAGGLHIDLLMADLEMPALSGEEMVRKIRADHRDVKVLYVSGVVDRLLDERPQLWEGEAFLEKPFTPSALCEAVNLLCYGTLRKPSR